MPLFADVEDFLELVFGEGYEERIAAPILDGIRAGYKQEERREEMERILTALANEEEQ